MSAPTSAAALDHVVVHGLKIPLGLHLHASVAQSMAAGHYESDELHALQALLQPDDVVLELGTGIGVLATFCAKLLGADKVHTFEANPALESVIRRTFALNDVAPRLEICVLGQGSGELSFFVDEAFWSSSLLPRGAGATAIQVPVRDFNEEVARLQPTLMVIDIEGGELELLRHADLGTLRTLVIELHPGAFGAAALDEVVSGLYARGFAALRRASSGDVLALRRGAEDDAMGQSDAVAHLAWSRWQRALATTLRIVPPQATAIVVDDGCWPEAALEGRLRRHLMDKDGDHGGLPGSDDEAVAEVERLRGAGAGFLVLACTAQWWRAQYPGLFAHLHARYACNHDSADLLIFALDRPAAAGDAP